MEEHYKESYALKSIAFRGTGSGQELGRIQPLESHWTRSLDKITRLAHQWNTKQKEVSG